jgi:hypothetical protein
MALKQNPELAPAVKSGGPAWGVLVEKGESAQVVRFVVGDRSVSFPVHSLKRWEFVPGTPDTLGIATGGEIVTVQGHGLAAVRDALDAGALLVLRVKSGRGATPPPGETVVTDITFAVEKQ